MTRLILIIWFCLGAFGLGLTVLEANKRKILVSKIWYIMAILLGPIYLFFILPLVIGRWGDG